jgi:simple sugar transport system substrate-binding protein
MKKLTYVVLLTILGALVLTACGAEATPQPAATQPAAGGAATQEPGGGQASGTKYEIATVVKISGINWFNRMEEGVKRFATDTGHNSYQQGPSQADAAQQVQLVQDLIAKKPNAITIVPFSQEAVEPVLKQAMDQGIVVIAHEASAQQNINYDIEAFDNKAYGEHLMDALAKGMGEEGEYALFVGGLTSKSHNEWVDAALALQKEKYPNMKQVGDKQETKDDQQIAYQKAKEILAAYPNIKGFQGSASTDVAGIGLALEEAGLQDKTTVVGTSLPSISKKYIETGAVDLISFWDPADAGYAMNKLAVMMLDKQEIKDGMDLGIPGYEQLSLQGKVLYGKAWVDVTKDNLDKYDF